MNANDKLHIVIIPESSTPVYYDLTDAPLIIGRSLASCDIAIDDRRISRVHLHIERTSGGGVNVMDLDTLNGTTLSDAPLSAKEMIDWPLGHKIVIGKTTLILKAGAAPDNKQVSEHVSFALDKSGDTRTIQQDTIKRLTTEMKILSSETSTVGRLLNTLGMVLVLALSLALLAYVGFGEASRTFPTIELDRLAAQGEVVANSMDASLKAGLSLDQLPGFSPLTQPVLDSDPSLVAIYVTDLAGKVIFLNSQPGATDFNADQLPVFAASSLKKDVTRFSIGESEAWYRISLELNSKFEALGHLNLILPKSVIEQQINRVFTTVFIAGGILLALFALYVAVDIFVSVRRRAGTRNLLNWIYGLVFLLMAFVVVITLVNLYSSGIQNKTQALANSLGQRLNAPLELGLDITDFADLDEVFQNYQTLNPDLSFIALASDNEILIHTDSNLVGQAWVSPPNHFEYTLLLRRPGALAASNTELHVGIPTSAVYSRLWSSVKNFVVLFVAAGFLSLLFFNLMRTFIDKRALSDGETTVVMAAQQKTLLGLIRPFYFLAVFAEGLAASFLPQYLRGLASASSADTSLVSTLFTVYFLSFVIALIPSGQFAERRGVKPLLIAGALCIGIAMFLTAFVTNFYLMFPIRALAGLGQGMLLIGVQSYILEVAVGGQKTQGAAIIVFGYNGGMISGTAIGALLVLYMQPRGVFIAGAATALFALMYTLTLIPRLAKTEAVESTDQSSQGFLQNLRDAASDFEFVKAMLFIGIPAKAVLTGVTIFALPLLLANQYAQDDIGQIIMLYAAGVLISSSYVSRLVDRVGKTTGILFTGTIGSGIGLVMIGLAGLTTIPANLKTILLIVGMIMLGLAHGFIHAPIVTHISGTSAANALGKSSATSLYRFLERIGHVSGPIIVGQLLLFSNESLLAISWLGLVTILFGILFLIRLGRGSKQKQDSAELSPAT